MFFVTKQFVILFVVENVCYDYNSYLSFCYNCVYYSPELRQFYSEQICHPSFFVCLWDLLLFYRIAILRIVSDEITLLLYRTHQRTSFFSLLALLFNSSYFAWALFERTIVGKFSIPKVSFSLLLLSCFVFRKVYSSFPFLIISRSAGVIGDSHVIPFMDM